LKKVGAWGPMPGVEVALGNNKKVKSRAYALTIAIEGVEAPSICLTFKNVQSVIGVETLESIGMKLDPATEKFELTRPKGLAYFF
jgi:predicted aspartyl protease